MKSAKTIARMFKDFVVEEHHTFLFKNGTCTFHTFSMKRKSSIAEPGIVARYGVAIDHEPPTDAKKRREWLQAIELEKALESLERY